MDQLAVAYREYNRQRLSLRRSRLIGFVVADCTHGVKPPLYRSKQSSRRTPLSLLNRCDVVGHSAAVVLESDHLGGSAHHGAAVISNAPSFAAASWCMSGRTCASPPSSSTPSRAPSRPGNG